MLSAVIPLAKTVPAGRTFLEDLVRLCRGYVPARNALAHDGHYLVGDSPHDPLAEFTIGTMDGRSITTSQIAAFQDNLSQLVTVLNSTLHQGRPTPVVEPELCLELLGRLSTDPLALGPDQSELMPLIREVWRSSQQS